MGSDASLEGPGAETPLADVEIGYWIEPLFYIVANGALTALCGRSLKNELKDPRSQEIVNMKKLMTATEAVLVVWNIFKLPPIYIEPYMWQVEEIIHLVFSTALSALMIHFNWLAVFADYTSNLKQDQQGLERFTQDSIKLCIAANLVFLAASLGRAITGKILPWQKVECAGWSVVIAVFARGMYSYYMIHKKCMKTLRNDISVRIRNSKMSSKSDLTEVSKQNFDLSNVTLTRSEKEQQEKLDKIHKKVFILLFIVVSGFIASAWQIAFGWDFKEVSWIDYSKPYVENIGRDLKAHFTTFGLVYMLWYFRVTE